MLALRTRLRKPYADVPSGEGQARLSVLHRVVVAYPAVREAAVRVDVLSCVCSSLGTATCRGLPLTDALSDVGNGFRIEWHDETGAIGPLSYDSVRPSVTYTECGINVRLTSFRCQSLLRQYDERMHTRTTFSETFTRPSTNRSLTPS
jgi:hypothetical protein